MAKEELVREESEEVHAQEESDSSGIYKLSTPIKFDGELVTQLDLRFDDLTGKDLILCAKHARRLDPQEVRPGRALSLSYQIAVAARAAGVPTELLEELKGDDFTIVTQRAENFLLRRG
ncbi:phage tail assembly protein [Brevibacillus panacihumi]|uniref:Phage tail assembly protein n=1 Tax=Brevibacillus panacihumi TaxID=497735 RepID=A0A3M8C8Z3_9BACL|nr:phage tail assembly protein [Brevibacillus panacihumi]RNB72176.1 phage tail assembly protein [Brevibacillus panacihumi]